MIQEDRFGEQKVFKVENDSLAAWIAPEVGANVYRLQLKNTKEDIFRIPENADQLRSCPVFFGMPLLIPPNRIRNGMFEFEGEKFHLPINTPEGHHIHGMTLDRPWRFLSADDTQEISSITFSFDVIDHPDLYQLFPVALKFEYTVSILECSLETELKVVNMDKFTIPIGAGFHTWFHLSGGAEKWHLQLPFEKIWELDEESFPTGALSAGNLVDLLRAGVPLGQKNFDTIFYRGHNPGEATLIRDDGFSITYTVSDEFKHWVLHTPQDGFGSCIAIEPYSWVTDAPNLTLPHRQTGVLMLVPSSEQSFHSRIQIG